MSARFNASLPLPELRVRMIDAVNTLRDKKIEKGVTHLGATYESDRRSLSNLTDRVASIAGGAELPAGFVWRDADNNPVSHTKASLKNLHEKIVNHYQGCYERAWTLKDQIRSSDNPQTIDIKTGWP